MKILKIFFAAIVGAACMACSDPGGYVSISGFAQGGTYIVKLNLDGPDGTVRMKPEAIKEGIDSILLRIDNSVSGYNKGSLLSRFNAGETIVPDDIFLEIYRLSYKFYELTDGAFDVAAGPLFDIWGFGFKGEGFPDDEKVEEVRAGCGMSRLLPAMEEVIAEDGTLSQDALLRGKNSGGPAIVLNYNAIAQGYSCDLVARYLYSIGVKDMLIDVGGEIYCDGVNPAGQPWQIGVDKPVDGNDTPGAELEGVLDSQGRACGIVTSGNYRKFYIKDGRKFAHTVDPRSGYPVSHSMLSATIMAADATTADALATFCMVVGLDEAIRFVESSRLESVVLPQAHALPSIDGYFIYDNGNGMLTWSSLEPASN
ncbi:MAG: FAD:protein FMN transferase [Bacteroidales bacterium]|nr:FAD:protein FMN transferase [Bacteroidales bacterium]